MTLDLRPVHFSRDEALEIASMLKRARSIVDRNEEDGRAKACRMMVTQRVDDLLAAATTPVPAGSNPPGNPWRGTEWTGNLESAWDLGFAAARVSSRDETAERSGQAQTDEEER